MHLYDEKYCEGMRLAEPRPFNFGSMLEGMSNDDRHDFQAASDTAQRGYRDICRHLHRF